MAAALLLSACGAVHPPSSACSGPTCPTASPSASASDHSQPGVTASAHGWTTAAAVNDRAIDVRVTVPGPLTVEGGCVPSLVAWLVGADGVRVEATPTPGARCYAISLGTILAGQVREFAAGLPLPHPGVYTVHGLVRTHLPIGAGARVSENIPVVSISVP